MKILFDQCAPAPLRRWLAGHTVATAFEMGWSNLKNGDLLRSAEDGGFEVLITTDTNLKYQQNLTGRRIAIVALNSTSWPRIEKKADQVASCIDRLNPGTYMEIPI